MSDVTDVPIGPTDTSSMSQEQIEELNLRVVQAHFHNETPDSVDKAIALYADKVTWEAPNRGVVLHDPAEIKKSYMGIFSTVHYNRTYALRRFARGNTVFDDQVADLTVVGDQMPNLGFKPGDRISMRLVHIFELENGQITREIAYEMSRLWGGPRDHDAIIEGAVVEDFPDGPDFGKWEK
ncbi:nuclear transport factor 2 family protein [Flexivirga meconopsidis]|uniref:nuclear transport factor 2 family protein n=1 Tax=Flexivirga meconopsidis TaxID=2977121 RepID=UPI00223F2DC1|nr:nuclear transport factor 2 family protein [Flexivirga meconopsidis]